MASGGAAVAIADAGRVEASAPTNVYYVSGTGLDTNPGTQDKPFQSLARAHQVAQAGTQIWIMPGKLSYPVAMILTKSGTQANPIRVWAMPGARPVLDYSMETKGMSSARGIEIRGNYWHIKGLEIANAGDNCINISGSYNTVEDVIMHDCGDTGLQITVPDAEGANNALGANNTILNCDSYANLDTATGGENADGFAAKLQIGPGNVFRGCRAWNNADDGWDFFAANDVVVIDNCWAFSNGKTVSGKNNPQGDGNGFKLGRQTGPEQPRAGRRGASGHPFLGVRESLLRIRAQQQPQQAHALELRGALEPQRRLLRSLVLTDRHDDHDRCPGKGGRAQRRRQLARDRNKQKTPSKPIEQFSEFTGRREDGKIFWKKPRIPFPSSRLPVLSL